MSSNQDRPGHALRRLLEKGFFGLDRKHCWRDFKHFRRSRSWHGTGEQQQRQEVRASSAAAARQGLVGDESWLAVQQDCLFLGRRCCVRVA